MRNMKIELNGEMYEVKTLKEFYKKCKTKFNTNNKILIISFNELDKSNEILKAQFKEK